MLYKIEPIKMDTVLKHASHYIQKTQNKIVNEGFLYINTHSNETFKRGEITDISNNLVCPGVIVPIINPIQEANREESDTHLVSIDSYVSQITLYYSLNKRHKLRVYWDKTYKSFLVSSELCIYPEHCEMYDLSSVNFALLDKKKCYYCITDAEKGVILTNTVFKENPNLEVSYNIADDLAFEHHIEWEICNNGKELLKEIPTFEYGIWCILADGRQLELRNKEYNYYCMLAKPEHMPMSMYYILCLNKDAEGKQFGEYFNNLHEYVREHINVYPENTNVCVTMSYKILSYLEKYEFTTDSQKINAIKMLLDMEPDEVSQYLNKCTINSEV